MQQESGAEQQRHGEGDLTRSEDTQRKKAPATGNRASAELPEPAGAEGAPHRHQRGA